MDGARLSKIATKAPDGVRVTNRYVFSRCLNVCSETLRSHSATGKLFHAAGRCMQNSAVPSSQSPSPPLILEQILWGYGSQGPDLQKVLGKF